METEQNKIEIMRTEFLCHIMEEMIRQQTPSDYIETKVEQVMKIWDKHSIMPDQEPATPHPVMVDDPVGSTWIPETATVRELQVWRKIKHITMTVGNATTVFALCVCDGSKTELMNWLKLNALYNENQPKDSRGHYVLATSTVVDALLDLNPLRFRNVLEYAQRIKETKQ